MKRKNLRIITGLLASFCFWTASVSAAELLSVGVHSSRYVSMPTSITRIAVGDPEIATIVRVPSSRKEFLVVAHKAGTTSLFVWGADGARYEYIVGVSPEDEGQAKVIESAIGLPGVRVKMVDGKVLLTGTVENQYERNYAMRTAQLFVKDDTSGNLSVGSNANMRLQAQTADKNSRSGSVGGNTYSSAGSVIDLLHLRHPSQIKLEAQVVAINPTENSDLGFVYGSGTGSDLISSPGVFYGGQSYGSGGSTTFRNNPWTWLTEHHSDINVALRALVTQNRAKILSRPSITTMSGEEAVIQVGGEIPYTTRDKNGNPTTEFKDYGIILQFKPLVDAENRIVSSIHTEVSMPSGETIDNQPILDKRRADAVVTATSGSTMVIGGLMDSREYKVVRKFPFLGDIPIIGEFFKYTSKSRNRQELIILVTPRLVDENSASKAEMTNDMHKFYQKGQQEKATMKKVDLNEESASAEKKTEEAVEEKASAVNREGDDSRQVAAEMASESVLDKYLNRDVLKKK
ncbi:type II and III secretion system protein family protein [Selenomonas ruminantium]|uniref:type II and III secretion system protein family protein n=1 Tax=Selenomonas ruminantium TaxID=971 RepID=UPI0026EDA462|nr:pilus assembly protein N-terminal domain-containing protein [Selenomonas ruminantium]